MKISVPEDILIQDLGGELVLLNLQSEHYFGLDNVGTSMWHAVTKTGSLEAACQQLLTEYETEPQQLQQDLRELVEQLVTHGLLQIVEA